MTAVPSKPPTGRSPHFPTSEAPTTPIDAAPPAGSSDPLLGRLLDGRYRVLEPLAEGGMGKIYRAEHLGLRKQVALKLVHDAEGEGRDHAQRFLREALLTSRIDHPNVISAMDYGTFGDGTAYLAMSLVSGPTLSSVIESEHGVLWPRAAEIAAQIADAAAAAQAQNIVHRDLKPENVIVQPLPSGGELVKVLDFGIAKYARDSLAPPPVSHAQKVTRVGTVVGTPGYMAPEQAVGMRADHRADLYSIGVILWECIVGRKLWDCEDLQQLIATQLSTNAPSLREASGDDSIPEALEKLVARLLSRRAHERPENAIEVRDALRALTAEARAGKYEVRPLGQRAKTVRAKAAATTLAFRGPARPPEPDRDAAAAALRALPTAVLEEKLELPVVTHTSGDPPPIIVPGLGGPQSDGPIEFERTAREVTALPEAAESELAEDLIAGRARWPLLDRRAQVGAAAAIVGVVLVAWAFARSPTKSQSATVPAPRPKTAGSALAAPSPEAARPAKEAQPASVVSAPPSGATANETAIEHPTPARTAEAPQRARGHAVTRAQPRKGAPDAETLRARARAEFQAGKYEQAAESYREAQKLQPNDAGLYAGLGACLLAAGDARGALASYQQAAQLSPKTSGFQAALGRCYLAQGDRARALASYRKALALDPHNQAALTAIARLEH